MNSALVATLKNTQLSLCSIVNEVHIETTQREQNQKSKPTLGVTMMHHATKRGFKDRPVFLNSTGRLGPKRGRKCYITPAFSGVPNKGGQNQNSKPPLRVTMMPLGAPSISKYGSLVRPGAQIVALRAHCA